MGDHNMETYQAGSGKARNKGFTLIASLLLLLLLSGLAIGLMMLVNTEGKVGGADVQNNVAYHAAEGGIEKMSSDLSAVFKNSQSPNAAQICNVGMPTNTGPTMVGVTWKEYYVAPGTTMGSACPSTLTYYWGLLTGGPDQGLWAQIIPVNMLATAALPGGQEVSMTRSAQVALIPVFQFGVFSEGDLGFFDSPTLDFKGRIHTNHDLYLGVSRGATLTFHNKLEAYGNIVTEKLPNGLAVTGGSWDDTGNVYIPTAEGGCTTTSTNCVLKDANNNPPGGTYGQGSVQGAGGNPPASPYNGNNAWYTFSKTTTNYEIINGNYGNTASGQTGTGAKQLSMPFVDGTTHPYELIRRPRNGEDPASLLGQSRDYNLAQIRILLSDDPAELPGGAADANNVRLANVGGATPSNQFGIATSTIATTGTSSAYYPVGLPALGSGNTYNLYFAAASNGIADVTNCNGTYCPTANTTSSIANDWAYGPATPAVGAQTLVPAGAPIVAGTGGSGTPAPVIPLCPPTNVASGSIPAGCPTSGSVPYPYYANVTTTNWNLIDGYLRVEYKDSTGNWNPVTMEWLQLGFARGTTPPTAAGANPINPNAILLLQEPADRRATGSLNYLTSPRDFTGLAPVCNHVTSGKCDQWSNPLPPEVLTDASMSPAPSTSTNPWFGVTNSTTATQSISAFNYYPINFYDAREGEARDKDWGNNSCSVNGLMNAVEIDVGNLFRWLRGTIGSSGPSVDYLAQNGYVLYFSDRRGKIKNPNSPFNGNEKSGDSGLEDVVNSGSAAGVPDGVLESPTGNSPEDVNEDGNLDNWGAANLGLGFFNGTTNLNGQIIAAAPDNPYLRMNSCATTGRKNWVSGARHVLKLVDGAFGNVPRRTDASATLAAPGGFTVASENPVYIQGDYNSNSADPFWTGGADITGHSSAAVIGDAVTILSNNWNDLVSTVGIPGNSDVTFAGGPVAGNRNAATTYYRVAIAGGKNRSFPFPNWEAAVNYGTGTDGGVHNFLRFLEDWSGDTLNYGGSLVSLYYATYNTGLFKCCTYSVYSPPVRNYIFDNDFTNPQGLPPGTPMFRDVNTLGYRQLFTTRNSSN